MKLVTLIENTTCREDLSYEHGLSLYLECRGKRILFDMGQTEQFAENAQKLGVDLSQVDIAVLSHGHNDHGGGLKRFLQCNDRATVYVHRDAFMPHFNKENADISLDSSLLESGRIVLTEGSTQLAPGLTLYSADGVKPALPVDHAGLQMLEQGILQPDDFRHEQYLLLEENGKRVCISGCSHKGVINIAEHFRPHVLVGGFHFMKRDVCRDRDLLEMAAKRLLSYGTVYYTGHCTGQEQYAFLKERMKDKLHGLSTGTQLMFAL